MKKLLNFLRSLSVAFFTIWFLSEYVMCRLDQMDIIPAEWVRQVKPHAGAADNISYVGPGLAFNDENSNIPVGAYTGGTNYKVLMSFRASHSGNLTKFRTYFQAASTDTDPGYSAGTCGTMVVRIWPSDNGTPPRPKRNGEALSEGQVTFTCTNGGMPFESKWPWVKLTPRVPLVANTLYFVEIANVDPNPSVNWVSVNAICALPQHVTINHRIGNQLDWSLYREDAANVIYNVSTGTAPGLYSGLYHFPSAEVVYADGTSQGYIRLEPGNNDGYMFAINSGTRVRERFNVTESMRITGVEIHASTSVAGSLRVSFVKNGVTETTGTITENPAAYYTLPPNSNGVYSWYTVDLSSDKYVTVNSGDTLDIEMTAAGSAVWRMAADRTGVNAFSANAVAMYTYSSAQYWNGNTWVNTLYYNHDCAGCLFATSHFRVILKTVSTNPIPSYPLTPPTGLRIVTDN